MSAPAAARVGRHHGEECTLDGRRARLRWTGELTRSGSGFYEVREVEDSHRAAEFSEHAVNRIMARGGAFLTA